MGSRKCLIKGCTRKHKSRGLCSMHYERWRKHGSIGSSEPMIPKSEWRQCSLEGCERGHHASGYCSLHYHRHRTLGHPGPTEPFRARKVCSVAGCEKQHATRGYCGTHYARWARHGTTELIGRPDLKASRSATTKVLYWAAGFLEGEGAFGDAGRSRDGSGPSSSRVGAFQIEKEPLEQLRNLFGGSIRTRPAYYNKQGQLCREGHRWIVTGTRARGVMLTLYTLLSTRRREQIRTHLANLSLCKRNAS